MLSFACLSSQTASTALADGHQLQSKCHHFGLERTQAWDIQRPVVTISNPSAARHAEAICPLI